MPHPTIVATDRAHLRKLVLKALRTEGDACDLNHIDVSNVEDMTKLFSGTEFNGNIARWNTTKVQTMEAMFSKTPFNGDVSAWDVSKVTNTQDMFKECKFTGDLTHWRLDSLRSSLNMFKNSAFQGGMPRMASAQTRYMGDFPIKYRGSMNDYYSLDDMSRLFREKRWVDWYLEQTFDKRVDRVHIEKMVMLATRPKWCSDKALFKWVGEQQHICEQLGLMPTALLAVVVQQYRSKATPSTVPDTFLDAGDLFSNAG